MVTHPTKYAHVGKIVQPMICLSGIDLVQDTYVNGLSLTLNHCLLFIGYNRTIFLTLTKL